MASKLRAAAGVVALATMTGAAERPSGIACRVAGAKLIVPAMTERAICDRFAARLSAGVALGTIEVDLSFARNGTATATVRQRIDGRDHALPEAGVAVSDRAIGADVIDRLADAVAGSLQPARVAATSSSSNG